MTSEHTLRYRQEVAAAVRSGHRAPPKLSCRLDIAVLACPPDSYGGRWWDLDNYWKVVLDSLKRAGVVTDDRLFDHEEIFRGSPVAGGRLLVSVFPYDPDESMARLILKVGPGPDVSGSPGAVFAFGKDKLL